MGSFDVVTSRWRNAVGGELPAVVCDTRLDHPRAAVILFHGGALRGGSAVDVLPHCRRLAADGILAVAAGYRLLGHGASSIRDCLDDVATAVHQFRRLARSREVPLARTATGGSSAGAHLALLQALSPRLIDARQAPAAVVALNPAGLDLRGLPRDQQAALADSVGVDVDDLFSYSLVEHIGPSQPQILIHHGTADAIESIDVVRRFRDVVRRAGNSCTVHEYADAPHGFHYPNSGNWFDTVMTTTAKFLTHERSQRANSADAPPKRRAHDDPLSDGSAVRGRVEDSIQSRMRRRSTGGLRGT